MNTLLCGVHPLESPTIPLPTPFPFRPAPQVLRSLANRVRVCESAMYLAMQWSHVPKLSTLYSRLPPCSRLIILLSTVRCRPDPFLALLPHASCLSTRDFTHRATENLGPGMAKVPQNRNPINSIDAITTTLHCDCGLRMDFLGSEFRWIELGGRISRTRFQIAQHCQVLDAFRVGAEGAWCNICLSFLAAPFLVPLDPMYGTDLRIALRRMAHGPGKNATQHEWWQTAQFRGKDVSTRLREAEARVACQDSRRARF